MDKAAIHYLPLATTIISAIFAAVILMRYKDRHSGVHLLWWGFGVIIYGAGTALEGGITLFGNSVAATKAWYIVGALLGGYPLATGSLYMLTPRRYANRLTWISLPLVAILSLAVVLSPANLEALQPHKPGGAVLGWQWIRWFSPLINTYAAIFLIGFAVRSATLFARRRRNFNRMVGNTLIAIGAILPGIGGGMAKGGIVEALYVGEFIGIILIWMGFRWCQKRVVREEQVEIPAEALTA
ncbi:hypothetical protein KDL29_09855 [bacterium]|nr:hypothetical protein [bacterium]